MSTSEVILILQEYLLKEIPELGNEPLRCDEPLFSSGLLDSAAAVQLMAFVEHRFGVFLSDKALCFDEFDTLDKLAALIVLPNMPVASSEQTPCG